MTVLVCAILNRYEEVARTLIGFKANVNTRSKEGKTAQSLRNTSFLDLTSWSNSYLKLVQYL